MERFEIYNQLIDDIKSLANGVEAYCEADLAKDIRSRGLVADAIRYRLTHLAKHISIIEAEFPRECAALQNLESEILPKRINQINEKLEPLRKVVLSEMLRLSIEN